MNHHSSVNRHPPARPVARLRPPARAARFSARPRTRCATPRMARLFFAKSARNSAPQARVA